MSDFRSDTVTLPTGEMRKAMAEAKVGDDVYGEDPTVKQLEKIAAKLMGKEAGLFVASGTMANLIAVLVHCQRGDEVLMGHLGHTFLFEGGGISALGGIFAHTLPNLIDGTMDIEEMSSAIRPDDIHQPHTQLLILENTHNRRGGVPISLEFTAMASELIHSHGMFLHLDGARIFNAAVALGVDAQDLVGPADSVTFCLSKGLSAPVGSVLCGSRVFIEKATRVRKMLGGGMRQAGILAAAGIVALETMIDRLADDHRRAMQLAKALLDISSLELDYGLPKTNMIFISLKENSKFDGEALQQELEKHGIRIGRIGKNNFRLVTHNGIEDEDISNAIDVFKGILV